MYNRAEKHIQECRNGKSLAATPVRAVVRYMGAGINTGQFGLWRPE
ncbi:MAG: hypothetical protein IPN62_14570 [Flavobacteriales bacterium]|nr:hypothetical protein [Flavobacteriales bacterium]